MISLGKSLSHELFVKTTEPLLVSYRHTIDSNAPKGLETGSCDPINNRKIAVQSLSPVCNNFLRELQGE